VAGIEEYRDIGAEFEQPLGHLIVGRADREAPRDEKRGRRRSTKLTAMVRAA
jgi:hypothetical protein